LMHLKAGPQGLIAAVMIQKELATTFPHCTGSE